MSKPTCKIHHVDNGFARVVYVTVNSEGQRVYYCLMDNAGWGHPNVECYRCTQPPHYEPDYQIKHPNRRIFEVPKGNTETEIAVREFLNKPTMKESRV